MFGFFIVYLIMIFVFVTPFSMGLNSFMSLNSKRAGGTFSLGFFSIRLSIESGLEGWEIDGIRGEDTTVEQHNKKAALVLDKRVFSKINVDRVTISFLYGKEDDAFQTCMVCNAVNNFFSMLICFFSHKIVSYRNVVVPSFNKDCLFLQVRLDFKINLLIIFSTVIKIIINKLRKKFRRM